MILIDALPISMALVNLAVILATFTLLWLLSLRLRNAAIVDIFWGPGFLLIAVMCLAQAGMATARGIVVLVLVTVWALRLAVHIFLRSAGKPEDFRYAAWRRQHGDRWPLLSLFMVFLLQGSILWIVSLPLQLVLVVRKTVDMAVWDYLGILLWIVGFVFQAVGDGQLARFRCDPDNEGRIMDRGLWRWTRHPNYFGESLMWWGIWLLAAGLPGGVSTIIGPALLTWLLVKVSGVAMLERTLGERPGYREYCARTSPFIPWFPRPVTPR